MNSNFLFAVALFLGLIAGFIGNETVLSVASALSQIFINLLKLVSLPIIFLSVVSTASGMTSLEEVKTLGKRVITYTLLTTVIAASIALVVFQVINPVGSFTEISESIEKVPSLTEQGSYLDYLVKVVPSNIIQPFSENHVIGVLFLALLLSLSILTLPKEKRTVLHSFFSGLYAAIMKITSWIVRIMPIGVWAFVTLFIKDLKGGLEFQSLALYLACVLIANLIQACIVLPLFLTWKGISPIKTFRGMFPALSMAFFTKSSSAALPLAIRCAEDNVGVSKKVSSFTLPLCTTINMNACAAFILTTVLFVSMSHGMVYSPLELILWIGVATIAAVGNAGVPMGCFFLSGAFLAAMNVPLNLMGIILPFYSLIDMLESSINVWSDSCVAAAVNRDIEITQPAYQPKLDTDGILTPTDGLP